MIGRPRARTGSVCLLLSYLSSLILAQNTETQESQWGRYGTIGFLYEWKKVYLFSHALGVRILS